MGGLNRRLERLEARGRRGPEDESEREREQPLIRKEAERGNRRREREDKPPLFEIDENGAVLCSHDGKPVTEFSQTLAEEWYFQEVEWGGEGLVHDEEAQVFYTQSGRLAVSRDRMDLQGLMGLEREEWLANFGERVE